MAKKSLVVKCRKLQLKALKELKAGKKITKSSKIYHRCNLCGRTNGYMRKFQLCRICFRSYASKGFIPGVTKSSW